MIVDIIIETKKCIKCKQEKPLSEFYTSVKTKDGFRNKCKICMYEFVCYYRQTKQGKKITKKANQKYFSSIRGKLAIRYSGIYARCYNPNHMHYKFYGAKGIKCKFCCKEFIDYILETWPNLNYKKYDVHRINQNGHYEIGNIRLLPISEHRGVKYV